MQKLPLRERRHKSLLNSLARMRKQKDEAIKTIVRVEINMPKVERRLRNHDKPRPAKPGPLLPPSPPTIEPAIEADGMPDFLRRQQPADAEQSGESREARMKAAGFHKTIRSRKKKPSVVLASTD